MDCTVVSTCVILTGSVVIGLMVGGAIYCLSHWGIAIPRKVNVHEYQFATEQTWNPPSFYPARTRVPEQTYPQRAVVPQP